jgi:hypothetical protein
VITGGIGFTVVVHVDLYEMSPLLAFIPLFFIAIVVHFLIFSDRSVMVANERLAKERLERVIPTVSPSKMTLPSKMKNGGVDFSSSESDEEELKEDAVDALRSYDSGSSDDDVSDGDVSSLFFSDRSAYAVSHEHHEKGNRLSSLSEHLSEPRSSSPSSSLGKEFELSLHALNSSSDSSCAMSFDEGRSVQDASSDGNGYSSDSYISMSFLESD